MYPHERSLVKQLADKPFAIIGVNSDSDREAVRKIVKEKNLTWRSFWNGPEGTSGPISTAWNVSGWPTIYVIDAEGRIRYKNARGEALDRAIETLLAEMGHEVSLKHDEEEGENHAEGDEASDAKGNADEGDDSGEGDDGDNR